MAEKVKLHIVEQEKIIVSSKRNTFSKDDRLLKRSEFLHLSKTGKRIQNRHFIAYVCKNKCNRCRLGLTVTRKVGKAVKRNHIKRLAREYFRQNRHIFNDYLDISLIAKKESTGIDNEAIFHALENIFVRISKYKPN